MDDGRSMSATPPPEPDRDIVGQWLRKAHDDLAVADTVLATTPSARWASCFHAQQAVEKTMKALLVLRAVDFPKTHSLVVLAGLLGATGDHLDIEIVKTLQPWAVAGRYPESAGPDRGRGVTARDSGSIDQPTGRDRDPADSAYPSEEPAPRSARRRQRLRADGVVTNQARCGR